jgi:hypothetical protein
MVVGDDDMDLPSSRVGESVNRAQRAVAAASFPTRPGFPQPRPRRDRTARVQLGSRWQGVGWDSSGSQLIDRRWIYEYDAWAEATALT